MTDRHTVDRDELYGEVWAEPMTKVSKRYGISDVALAKVCRKLSIPVPERGYWARIAAGRKLTRKPLPERPAGTPQKIEVHPVNTPHWKEPVDTASLEKISVADVATSPHRLTVQLQKCLAKQKPDSYGRIHSIREAIDVSIAPESVPRLMRIVDSFVKAAEERGFTFSPTSRDEDRGMSIVINGQPIRFAFHEASRRISTAPPKDHGRFSSSYTAPQYVPTGKLTFKILEYVGGVMEPSWSDRVQTPLENRLAEILHALKQAAVALREQAEERAKQQKLYAERAEEQRKYETQKKKLLQDLADWSTAETFRRFVEHFEANLVNEPDKRTEHAERWVAWVKRQADDLDPFSKGVEDFLDHYQQFGWDKMTMRR
jgi:hypothetical protein